MVRTIVDPEEQIAVAEPRSKDLIHLTQLKNIPIGSARGTRPMTAQQPARKGKVLQLG